MKFSKSRNRRQVWLCTMITGTLLLAANGIAQAEEKNEFLFEEMVITANRVPTKISESASNVEVITREEIAKGNYQNVGQILQHIPGVNIANNGNPGSLSAAYINGSEQVIVLIDGRRMNLPNGIGGFGMATTNLTTLVGVGNIERIEIVKGGRSALYGADAVGGVINIITRKGEKDNTTVTVAGGNWSGENYGFTHEGTEGDLSWYISVDERRAGDYTLGTGKTVKYTGIKQDAYTLRLDQKINDGTLSFAYENFANENEAKKANTIDYIRQHNWDISYQEHTSAATGYQVKIYQNGNHRFGSSSDYDVRVKGFNYQINSQIDENHRFITGIDWRRDEVTGSRYNRERTVKAVYMEDTWSLNDKLSFIPGLRYDKDDTYGSKTTPQFAATYKQSKRTSYYASWGKVFQAPRFDDLYYPYVHYDANPAYGMLDSVYEGNPDLKPASGWAAEIGVNHQFNDTVTGKISYFKRNLNDAISWKNVSTDPTKEHWLPSNVDKQKADGVEVQVRKQFTPEFSSSVAYNYLNLKKKTAADYEFIKDINTPDQTWNVSFAYEHDKVNIDLSGTANIGRTNPAVIEKDYWLWDANVNVALTSQYTVFVTMNNIFDKYYSRSTSSYPCGGRSYMIGVKGSF